MRIACQNLELRTKTSVLLILNCYWTTPKFDLILMAIRFTHEIIWTTLKLGHKILNIVLFRSNLCSLFLVNRNFLSFIGKIYLRKSIEMESCLIQCIKIQEANSLILFPKLHLKFDPDLIQEVAYLLDWSLLFLN